jgi:uncharacterized membrane protein
MFRMSSGVRKLALTTHVTSSVAWMGGVACFLVLSTAGFLSKDTQTVQAAYLAMNLICWFVVVPLSLASPLSGVIQAIGSPWGLTKHYWVLAKLLVTVPCSAILLLHMVPTTQLAAAAAQGSLIGDALRDLRIQLVADSAVALAVLLLTVVLAVYKPRGLTKSGTIAAGKRGAADATLYVRPVWVMWLRRFALALALAFLAAHLVGKGLGGHSVYLRAP